MISIDTNLTDHAVQQHIEQVCATVGLVRRVEVFLRPYMDAQPFALVYMEHPDHRNLIMDKFDGRIVGPAVVILITDSKPAPASTSAEELKQDHFAGI